MIVPCIAPNELYSSGEITPLAAGWPSTLAKSGPMTGTGEPGCAICQRIRSIRKNPNNMKHNAVKPY